VPFEAEWALARVTGLAAIVRLAVVVRFFVVAMDPAYQCWRSMGRGDGRGWGQLKRSTPGGQISAGAGVLSSLRASFKRAGLLLASIGMGRWR